MHLKQVTWGLRNTFQSQNPPTSQDKDKEDICKFNFLCSPS